jgi:hypothetical protein
VTPSEDAYRCWELAIAAKREQLVRSGTERPLNALEARWAKEGPRSLNQLDTWKRPA